MENVIEKKVMSAEEAKAFFVKCKEERMKAAGKQWFKLQTGVATKLLFLNDGIEQKDTQFGLRYLFNLGGEHKDMQLATTAILAAQLVEVLCEQRDVACNIEILKTGKAKQTRYSVHRVLAK